MTKVTANGVTVSIIAGTSLGQVASTRTRTPVLYLDITVEADATFTQHIAPGWNAFLYVLDGTI